MTDQELKDIWKGQQDREQVKLDKGLLLKDITGRIDKWNVDIKKRNNREMVAAAVVFVMFVVYGIVCPGTLTRIASFLLAGWSILVVVVLKSVKKDKLPDAMQDMHRYLSAYKMYMMKERSLLQKVLYWYVLPPTILLIMFFAGMDINWLKLTLLIGATLLCNITVYILNRKAVKEDVDPMLDRLEHTIKELEE